MANRDVNWFFGPKEYINSGIYKYSFTFIKKFEQENLLNINKEFIPFSSSSFLRIFYQLFLFPLKIIFFRRRSINIFSDESLLLATFFPFFPYKNSLFIIHDFRNYNLTKRNQRITDRIYFRLLTRAFNNLNKFKKIVVVSKFTKKTLLKKFNLSKEKLVVIENSFSFDNIKYVDKKSSFLRKFRIKYDSNKVIILTVSSDEDRKNILTCLKAILRLRNVIFIKIGKSIIQENRNFYLNFIKKNSLNNVYFVEDVSEEDLSLFYYYSDMFLFPSSFEGFGRPPIEAQSKGCPVISSSLEVLRENLGDSVLYLKNEKSPEELIKAIKTLMNDDSLKKSLIEKGYSNYKNFDVDKNYKKFYEIISNL